MPQPTTPISRVRRPLQDAARYYTRLAPWYDWLAASEKKHLDRGINLLDPQEGETILDIGSGTGYALVKMAARMTGIKLIGLDISPGMCRKARNRVLQKGVGDQIDLIQNHTLKMPFKDHSFEGVLCTFTLELFDTPELPIVLKEIRRVLKPGGRLALVSLSKDQQLSWAGRLYEKLHNRFPTWIDCRPIPTKELLTAHQFQISVSELDQMWGLQIIVLLAET